MLADRLLQSLRARQLYYRLSRVPGVSKVQRRVTSRLIAGGATRWMTVPAGVNEGRELLLDPRAELGYVRGDHEPWLQDLLVEWLEPGGTFYDVGSHIGFFAIAAAGIVGPEGTVVAVEPDPETYGRLVQNLQRNTISTVSAINAAAWDREGSVTFESSTTFDSGVRGAVSQGAPSVSAVSVPACLIDALSERVPDVVKLDVEGGEAVALRGAMATLGAGRTRWIIEVHGDDLANEVTALLNSTDHDVMPSSPAHAEYPDYRQDYLLAVPRVTAGTSAEPSAN